jgi:N-acetylmuramoyl-L-alanine amidase
MARWAWALLVASMLLWTAMTAAAGWLALRSDGSRASAADYTGAMYDVSAPGQVREVRQLAPEEIDVLRVGDQLQQDPVQRRTTGRSYAVPAYAGAAGVDRRVRSVDPEGPRPSREAESAVVRSGVVVLDPGHGRGDPGAVHYLPDGSGWWDITEAYSNLRNAELIRDRLVAMGYEVYLTREGEGKGPGRPLPRQFIVNDLFARVELARAVDADVYVAIHGNGASVKSISGPETWYCGKHQEGAANEQLARMLQQAMIDALHEYGYYPPDRGIKEDAQSHHSGDFCQFVVTRENEVPAALIEFLFLSNDADARVLIDDRAHQLLADHTAAAIDAFMRDRNASD